MSEGTSLTSYWINFFIEAGIPPADSAQYAMLFSDNRIDESMLLDLNKEYLNDIGISRLGDIIAVLKRAKEVHKKLVEERVLKTSRKLPTSKQNPDTGPKSLPTLTLVATSQQKKDSPMTRIIGHCLATNRTSSPVNITVAQDESMDASQEKSTGTTRKSRRNISLLDDLPLPSSQANTAFIEKLPGFEQRTSVFDRLGGGKSVSLGEPKTTSSDSSKISSESVFNRLGERKETLKRSKTSPDSQDDSLISERGGSPLRYAGVLAPKKAKIIPVTVTMKEPVALKKSAQTKGDRVNKTPLRTASEGILGAGSHAPKTLKERLEPTVQRQSTYSEVSSTDDSPSLKWSKRANVLSRLGKQQ